MEGVDSWKKFSLKEKIYSSCMRLAPLCRSNLLSFRRKIRFTKILLVVLNFNIALKKLFWP